jgi:polynucleotide 5'-kinase involved in rRNA processing
MALKRKTNKLNRKNKAKTSKRKNNRRKRENQIYKYKKHGGELTVNEKEIKELQHLLQNNPTYDDNIKTSLNTQIENLKKEKLKIEKLISENDNKIINEIIVPIETKWNEIQNESNDETKNQKIEGLNTLLQNTNANNELYEIVDPNKKSDANNRYDEITDQVEQLIKNNERINK